MEQIQQEQVFFQRTERQFQHGLINRQMDLMQQLHLQELLELFHPLLIVSIFNHQLWVIRQVIQQIQQMKPCLLWRILTVQPTSTTTQSLVVSLVLARLESDMLVVEVELDIRVI